MGPVLTWCLPFFLGWREFTKLAWLAQGSGTYISQASFFFFLFFFFIFLSGFKPLCASLRDGFGLEGSVWDVQLPEVQPPGQELPWLEGLQAGNWGSMGAPWAAAASAEHQEPLGSTRPPLAVDPSVQPG